MSGTTNVNDILKQLDTLNETTGIDVYIPSLKNSVKFKNLNLKQQKELLKSSVDESLTKLAFIVNFYNIIQDNIIDKINVNSFYTFDRIAIALSLRANGLDSNLTLGDTVIDLNDLINKVSAVHVDSNILSKTVEIDNFAVELEVPHLNVDRDVSQVTINKLKNLQSNDIKTLVGELFVHEIIKFVKTVTFKSETIDQAVSFSSIKVEDRLAIIEKFPSTLTSKILEFVKTYRDFESQFTTVGDNSIEIDGSFFSV